MKKISDSCRPDLGLFSFCRPLSALDCIWLDQTEPLVILVASIGFMEGSKAGMWTRLCLWAFGRSVCGKRRQPHFPENGATGDLLGFLRAAVFVCRIFMRTGEPAFYPEDIKLPLMMITAADLCVKFRLLSDYVSDAGAP